MDFLYCVEDIVLWKIQQSNPNDTGGVTKPENLICIFFSLLKEKTKQTKKHSIKNCIRRTLLLQDKLWKSLEKLLWETSGLRNVNSMCCTFS